MATVAAALFKAAFRDKNPKPGEHGYPARTRATLALVRQLLDFADDCAELDLNHQPIDDPGYALTIWIASAIEGAGLCEEARLLYSLACEKVRPIDGPNARKTISRATLATSHAIERSESPSTREDYGKA